MTGPPPLHGGHDPPALPALDQLRDPAQQIGHRLGVARQLRGQRLREAEGGPRARRRAHRTPAFRSRRDHARAHERRLARARRPDHGQQLPVLQALPQRRDLRLPPEEGPRLLLREAREPRVRALDLHLVQARRSRRSRQHRLQRQRQIVRRAETLLPPLREAPLHDPAQRRRHPTRQRRQLRRRLLQDRRQRRDRRLPPERVLPRQELVRHHPEREDVRPVVHRQPAHLLRGHVRHRPQDLPRPRGRRLRHLPAPARQPVQLLRQAEVQELHPPVRRHEQVLRLHVPVHDPLRVRRLQPVRRLGQEEEDLPLRRGPARQQLPQRLAVQKLRDDVRHALVRAHVEDRQDVRVAEGGDGPRLALEPRQPLGVAGHLLGQDLDRDLAPQTRVPRSVHLAHPPGPDEAEDLVRPETRAGREGHGRSAGSSGPRRTRTDPACPAAGLSSLSARAVRETR